MAPTAPELTNGFDSAAKLKRKIECIFFRPAMPKRVETKPTRRYIDWRPEYYV